MGKRMINREINLMTEHTKEDLENSESGVQFVNFGCRLNMLETQGMVDILDRVCGSEARGDWIILHSCAVTKEATRQFMQTLRRFRREKPTAFIAVVGCGAEAEKKALAEMTEVDLILGNGEKLREEIWEEGIQAVKHRRAMGEKGPYMMVDSLQQVPMGFSETPMRPVGRQKAFVQIQQGCDHRCTFCIVPLLRGNSQSLSIEEVYDRVGQWVQKGYQEVVLTGVDIASFGQERGETLVALLRRLTTRSPKGLKRLRLSSLDPTALTEDFCDIFSGEGILMPHIHLSLQSGTDLILKRMKRRHRMDSVFGDVARLRKSRRDILLGADIITGFPTETDQLFEETVVALEKLQLAFLHVFPFSSREGTPASKMPLLPKVVCRTRAKQLRELSLQWRRRQLEPFIGTQQSVLWEAGQQGYTPHYALVKLQSAEIPPPIGEISSLLLTALTPQGFFEGRVVPSEK